MRDKTVEAGGQRRFVEFPLDAQSLSFAVRGIRKPFALQIILKKIWCDDTPTGISQSPGELTDVGSKAEDFMHEHQRAAHRAGRGCDERPSGRLEAGPPVPGCDVL